MKRSSAHKNNGDSIDSSWGQANCSSPTTNENVDRSTSKMRASEGQPMCTAVWRGTTLDGTSIEFDGQAHLLLRICRIMVGLCLILIKNSFSFIMQQFFYPNNMHFQNGRNIPISSDRLTAVVDGLQELLKVILVINLNLNLLSIYWHSLICFGWVMNQSSDVRLRNAEMNLRLHVKMQYLASKQRSASNWMF